MNRIQATFGALVDQGRTALVPYITAGDPKPSVSVPLMHALVRAGADLIELGVPFSDPMADGPVIQRAAERALKHGVRLRDVLDMVRQFRGQDATTPVVLMGYLNPCEVMGYETFAAAAASAGVDGVLLVDLPPEEAEEWLAVLAEHGLDPIFLISPTTTPERVARICNAARGFVYYVSLKGVTGAANLDIAEVAERLKQIRQQTKLPIGVGFGINDADSAARVAQAADAVIIGSALVRRIEALEEQPDAISAALGGALAEMRRAMDAPAV